MSLTKVKGKVLPLQDSLSNPDGYKFIGEVLTIADLRTITPSIDGQKIKVTGYYSDSTIGGGYFISDLTDNTSPDDLGMVIVTNTGKRWKRILSDSKEINPDMFGAKTIQRDPSFDSQPAFQSAIEYVNKQNGGYVDFQGQYKILNAPFTYILPYDDGTYSPNFTSGEVTLPPEPQLTMPACLQLYSRVRLRGGGVSTSALDFGWNVDTGNIDIQQRIGIVARVTNYGNGTNTRMNTFVNLIGIDAMDIKNALIGFVSDGIMFNQSYIGDVQWANCGIATIIQGADSNMWGNNAVINCYAGIVVGGMWLQRNNTQSGGKWVPPYVDNTDIYSLGWVDYLHLQNLSASGKDYGDGIRFNKIDQFFDQYFYKSANSKPQSQGGRLTNKGTDGSVSNYDFDPYRGISGRIFSLISRYKRGNSIGKLIDNVKINYSPRVPIWTPNMGTSWYGYIDYAFSEQVGIITRGGGIGDNNDFYKSGKDPINTDQTSLPSAMVEGAIQCQRICYANTRKVPAATSATVTNDTKVQTNWVYNWDQYKIQPKTSSNTLKYNLVIDNTLSGQIIERMWPGRYEIQPLAFLHSDSNELHHWRTRTTGNNNSITLRNGVGGASIAGEILTTNIMYQGGRVNVYFSFTVSASLATNNNYISFAYFPQNSAGTHDFGSDLPFVNMIKCDVKPRILPVTITGSSETLTASVSVPTPVTGVRVNAGLVSFYFDQNYQNGVKYSDLNVGSIFSGCVTYNAPWGLYNSNEGLNSDQ